jgi:hypothetical protein
VGVLLLFIGAFLQVQPGQVVGISLQTIGVICVFASALWVLGVLIDWAYRKTLSAN